MKKTNLLVVALLGFALAMSGCATISGAVGGNAAYRAGHFTTLTYLLRKAKMSAQDVAAVEAIHRALAEVTVPVDVPNLGVYIDLLKVNLCASIEDKAEQALALYLLQPYLDAITVLIPDTVDVSLRCKTLQDFQRGVLNARKEYAFLLL